MSTSGAAAAPRSTLRAALPAALAQTGTGVAAHGLAAGCLPATSGLLLALPSALLGCLVVGRLLPGRPLLRLAAAQLAVHGVLLLAACAGGSSAHATGAADSVLLHLAALVAARGLLERAADRLIVATTGLARRTVRSPVLRPLTTSAPARPTTPARATARRPIALLRTAPRRGPPRRTPLPA